MADIRINALATTAASTASDDFVAVDGSANGTRKLNAYSPTFGGNVTVSGITTLNSYLQAGAALAFPGALGATNYYLYASSTLGAVLYGYGSNYDVHIANRSGARAISVDANTTNVGIGGNLTVSGGTITSGSGTLTLNSSANTVVLQSAGTTALTLDSSQNILTSTNGIIYTNRVYNLTGGATPLTIGWTGSAGVISVFSSGETTFAGIITTQSSGTGSGLVIKRNANPYIDFYDGGTSGTIRAEIWADNDGVSGGNFKIQTRNNAGALTLAATFDKSQNATFAGSITTSAPTGGAGAWELGVANNVSPTAPNRTITIEIGGTVYYLHAKTTND